MYYQYLNYVFKHKWYVFIECVKRGLYWQGLIHDWTKFLPSELIPYAYHFHGKHPPTRDLYTKNYCKPVSTGDPKFDEAWRHHIKRNKHHWQWWTVPDENGGTTTIEMPERYLLEMICDWIGAGKVQKTNGVWEWWLANEHKLQLHPNTKKQIIQLIGK